LLSSCRKDDKEIESKVFDVFINELILNRKIFEYGDSILFDTTYNKGIKKIIYGDYNFYSDYKTCLVTPINFYKDDPMMIENYFGSHEMYENLSSDYFRKMDAQNGHNDLISNN